MDRYCKIQFILLLVVAMLPGKALCQSMTPVELTIKKQDLNLAAYFFAVEDADRFPTRFDGLWNTRDDAMIPYDFEALKKDKVYTYFLRSLDAQLWYYVQDPLKQAQEKAAQLVAALDEELEILQGNRPDKSTGSVSSKNEN